MVKMAEGWPVNSPDKLEDICVLFCIQNIETLAFKDVDKKTFVLHPFISLPKSLCDKLVNTLITTKDGDYLDKLPIFSDKERTQISKLCLRNSQINTDQFKTLVNQPIVELELTNCHRLTSKTFQTIKDFKHTLKSLKIESCMILCMLYANDFNTDVLEETLLAGTSLSTLSIHDVDYCNLRDALSESIQCKNGSKINALEETVLGCTNLRTLSIHDVDCRNFKHVLSQMTGLTCLNLSDCALSDNNVRQLENLCHLVSLILHNVINSQTIYFVDYITKLKTLRHLDISVSNVTRTPLNYDEPTRTLTNLVTSLPKLISLDISGTNLADDEKIKPDSHKLEPTSKYEQKEEESIPGLKGRQLEFLGLMDCEHNPCCRDNIPAKKVTGHANEEQVLLSIEVYQDRPVMLVNAFNMLLYSIRRGENIIVNHCRALEGLLDGMQRHPLDKRIQITCSASLFYITGGEQKDNLTQQQKRRCLDRVLDGMENLSSETAMMTTGLPTLKNFTESHEILHCCARLIKVLLNMLKSNIPEDVKDNAQDFLNCLAYSEQRTLLGESGAIEIVLKIIKKNMEENECDNNSMMHAAWSFMWNITDETAQNCTKFIDCGGMDVCFQCLELFKVSGKLLSKIMGLMVNISEVKELRPQLMVSKYISVFSDLLEFTIGGIEVSYSAVEVLAHIASDGIEAWTITDIQRDVVLCRLTAAINRWDITSNQNCAYSSFEPLLELLDNFDTPPVQHWAIWALCNFTSVNPQRYCELLESEHGPERLKTVLEDERCETYLKNLINQILTNISEFKLKRLGC